jgi:hypothetical protein
MGDDLVDQLIIDGNKAIDRVVDYFSEAHVRCVAGWYLFVKSVF